MEKTENVPYQVIIEIVNKQCKGLKVLKESGIQNYRLFDIREGPRNRTRHLIKIDSGEITKIPYNTFTKAGESFSFDSEGCGVCNTIMSNYSFLVSAMHLGNDIVVYNFVVPNFEAFRDIVSTLEKDQPLKVLKLEKFRSRKKILTEKQDRILWVALKTGFFEFPRKITMKELSQKLGIAMSTLSEILRRGIRRLLTDYFKK